MFTSNFERKQDIAKWTLTDGSTPATIVTANPISGSQSVRCHPVKVEGIPASQIIRTVDKFGAGQWVYRFRVRFDALPDVDMNISNVNLGGAFFNVADSKIYAGSVGEYTGASGVSVIPGVIYVIDARMDTTTTDWTCDVSVNGEICGQAIFAGPAPVLNSKVLNLGLWNTTGGGNGDATFDDVALSTVVSDYPIGF